MERRSKIGMPQETFTSKVVDDLGISTDNGYGICVRGVKDRSNWPSGYIVEIHFYDKDKAAKCADMILSLANIANWDRVS